MSLDHARIVAEAVAKLEAQGFNKDAAPKVGTSGMSGLEVVIDALADATVHEIETHGTGTGGPDGQGTTYTQTSPATLWGPPGGIPHTLGRRAQIMVTDSTGRQVFGSFSEPNIGFVLIQFANPMSGQVRLD